MVDSKIASSNNSVIGPRGLIPKLGKKLDHAMSRSALEVSASTHRLIINDLGSL